MFFAFTKGIICEALPAMRDQFDEDHIIFHSGLSLSGCYSCIRLRRFFILIKKLVRGPMDELQADYDEYIRSRSQHPVEFRNAAHNSPIKGREFLLTSMILEVSNEAKEHILDQRPTPMPSPLTPLRCAGPIANTPAGSPVVPQGAEDRVSV